MIADDFTKVNDPEGFWVNIPQWAKLSVERAIKAGIVKWDNPEEIIGDATLEAMLVKVGGLTSQLGNVSKVRMAVAMVRLSLFGKFI